MPEKYLIDTIQNQVIKAFMFNGHFDVLLSAIMMPIESGQRRSFGNCLHGSYCFHSMLLLRDVSQRANAHRL